MIGIKEIRGKIKNRDSELRDAEKNLRATALRNDNNKEKRAK